MPDLEKIRECPDCASANIVHNMEREQIICRDCGRIYEPLPPAEEVKFETSHDLTMPQPSRRTVKAPAAKKAIKAAPKKAKKK